MRFRRILPALLTAFLWTIAAQGKPVPERPLPLTRSDLETWLDGLLPFALTQGDVPGAVVVVVKDGAPFFAKGYGFADLEKRIPMDPEKTLIRPGSISKLFTWTAVMQQIEQGKLDLDRDVNDYLDFKIPATYPQPITLRHLMTHTAGFEETSKEAILEPPATLRPLAAYLRTSMPARIFPPGQIPAYSNYGTSLAGYIVARTAGEDFDSYVERHIFQPLGMASSTFRQPLPRDLAPRIAQGYGAGSEGPKPFELFTIAPAGSLTTSATDMARFMIAHLQDGRFEGAAILRPETARVMRDSGVSVTPPLNRMLLGFYEDSRNGRRVIGHSGDTQWFHSLLRLLPSEKIGLFISMNGAGQNGATHAIRSAVFATFMDRYFPATPATDAAAPPTADAHARMLSGRYETSRELKSSFFSLLNLLEQIEVRADSDGTVESAQFLRIGDQRRRFREIAPFVWREIDGQERLAAKVENGKVASFSVDESSPWSTYLPVPWWESGAWLIPALIVAIGLLAVTAAAGPLQKWFRGARAGSIRTWIGPACAITVVDCILIGLALIWMTENFTQLTPALDPIILGASVATALVFAVGAAAALHHAVVMCTTSQSAFARTWSLLLLPAFAVLIWAAVAFRVFAFHVQF